MSWRSSSVSAPSRDQIDLLVQLGRKLAHQARQAGEQPADRLHPGAHDRVLQIGGQAGQPLQRRLDRVVFAVAGDFEKLVAVQHQFGDELHDALDRVHGDADGLAAPRLAVAAAILLSCARSGSGRLVALLRGTGAGRLARGCVFGISGGSESVCRSGIRSASFSRLGSAHARLARRRHPLGWRRHLPPVRRSVRHRRPRGSAPRTSISPMIDLMRSIAARISDTAFCVGGTPSRRSPMQGLRRMGDGLQTVETEKARCAFDGMNEPEDARNQRRIGRVALELHELRFHALQMLAGFRQKFAVAVSSMDRALVSADIQWLRGLGRQKMRSAMSCGRSNGGA